ncbi:MAG: Rrf2 family transcriptional regulator [Gemmatimonadales bacterium]|nr:Rrf2 family transcriptional regulator [Gemmatimonadales bacterium]
MFSDTAEYALRAVLYLAQHQGSGPHPAAEIAERLRVPANYLSKILHALALADVVQSSRGKRGGFELSRHPGEISLLSVVSVFDSIDARRRCLLGREECSDDRACPVHARWGKLGEEVARFVRETTLADLEQPTT